MMELFILLSLAAAFGWGVTNVIDDGIMRSWNKDRVMPVAIISCLSRIALIPILFVLGLFPIPSISAVLITLGLGVIFFLGVYFYYMALDQGEVVGFAVFSEASPLLVLGGSLLLGGALTSYDIIGVTVITGAAVIVSTRRDEFRQIALRSETVWMVLSTVSFAILSLIADIVAPEFSNPIAQMSWMWVGVTLSAIGYLVLTTMSSTSKTQVRAFFNSKKSTQMTLLILLATVAESIAYVSYFEALNLGNVAIASAISSTKPFFVLGLSLLVPSSDTRHLSSKRKSVLAFSAALMIVGVYLTQL